MKNRFLIVILILITPLILNAQIVNYSVISDTLKGSKIQIAQPMEWNHDLLIIAHGYNPVDFPLCADFSAESPFFRKLLDKGWIIASTSYRRNGMIIRDAVEDIAFLKDYINEEFGIIDTVIVSGSSMGGAIGTVIAERHYDDYSGIITIGAALQCRDEDDPHEYNYVPQIPIIFLSPIEESSGPAEYISMLKDSSAKAVLYTVDRAGHGNVNDLEYEIAFTDLLKMIQGDDVGEGKDVTTIIERRSTANFRDGGAYTKIINVSSKYGSFNTEFTMEDMDVLGISKGDYFVVSCKDNSFRILYGDTYSDVARGEWIAFFTADNRLKIAMNFDDAHAALECDEGDVVFMSKE